MGPLARVCVAGALLLGACGAEPPATEPLARGRQVYRALDGGSCPEPNLFGIRSGPPLEHVGALAGTRKDGTAAADYLRESLESPGAYLVRGYADAMPRALTRRLSPADADALIAYLLSLR